MKQSIIASAALLLAPSAAGAIEPTLPADPLSRAMQCTAYTMVVAENLYKAENHTDESRAITSMFMGSMLSWVQRAEAMDGYEGDRFDAEVSAFAAGPLGRGPDGLDLETRQVNINTCVNEALAYEREQNPDEENN